MESIKEAWESILTYLKESGEISTSGFSMWISCIEPREIRDGNMVVFVHTDFQKNIIKDIYAEKIKKAIEVVMSIPLGLKIISGEATAAATAAPVMPEVHELSVNEYNFDNFVVGSSNRFAHAASQAVAMKPAVIYNPLFIYGGSGLGKTHLLHAICNEIKRKTPDANIIYTNGETLTNELIDAIQNGTNADFRAKYRTADVFLIDDIQFIAGKTATQEEFFHTFEALEQADKQIVLTSDRPPKEIATLSERLRSRFEMGLLADIQPPDMETRIAIVKTKAAQLEMELPDDVVEFIATQLKSNVRQLEGAVKNIRAQWILEGEKPSRITAQNAIRNVHSEIQANPITVDRVLSEVARTMNVKPEEIRSGNRSAPISQARQIAAFVVRSVTSLSQKEIGKEFGNRDHSSIVYMIKEVEKRMGEDTSFKNLVNDIIKNISEK